MTTLTGTHFIGGTPSRQGAPSLRGVNPASGEVLEPGFAEATPGEIEAAAQAAEAAFERYASLPFERPVAFLRGIVESLLELGAELLDRAHAETALPHARLESERGRTVSQIRLFADLLEEGSWVEARIDPALPERTPIARPDLRRMLVPLGPVAVFGASNFPLAFSVAGGDTVSALAAGCPVIVKAHPGHPGTSELVARAVLRAVERTGMPDGVFSLLHGASPEVGLGLVSHPLVQAVGFTGSLRGGRALFDAAGRRLQPIPVYAEMGSSNPVFVLPGALAERGPAIAQGLAASVSLGAGQFCTNPGLTVLAASEAATAFLDELARLLAAAPTGTMVHVGIKSSYDACLATAAATPGVSVAGRGVAPGPNAATEAHGALLTTDSATWAREPRLAEEIFGPATLAVRCRDRADLLALARNLHGQLTATVHGTAGDLAEFADLLTILRRKAGRIVVNGFPTGVEVGHAMQHGGPYPATTDPRSTSVGTAAIQRFARPVCFQDVPDNLLPPPLQNANPRGIWRLLDGRRTREAL